MKAVYNVLRLHCKYRQVNNPFEIARSVRILTQANLLYIHALLQANTSPYLNKLWEQLFDAQGVEYLNPVVHHGELDPNYSITFSSAEHCAADLAKFSVSHFQWGRTV